MIGSRGAARRLPTGLGRGLRGAYNGYYGIVFSRLSGSRVICFDADPVACARVVRTCRLNGEVGDRIGVGQAYAAFEVNEPENCTTLDVVAGESRGFVPDLIKIDVEGADCRFL